MASSNGSNNHEQTPDSQTDEANEEFTIVTSKPFDSEIPQPPPDIPLDWLEYEYQPEANGTSDPPPPPPPTEQGTPRDPRQALLMGIRQGAELRRVQVQVRTY